VSTGVAAVAIATIRLVRQTKPGVQWKVRVLNLLSSSVFFWDFLS
jgi:hypothetical protein